MTPAERHEFVTSIAAAMSGAEARDRAPPPIGFADVHNGLNARSRRQALAAVDASWAVLRGIAKADPAALQGQPYEDRGERVLLAPADGGMRLTALLREEGGELRRASLRDRVVMRPVRCDLPSGFLVVLDRLGAWRQAILRTTGPSDRERERRIDARCLAAVEAAACALDPDWRWARVMRSGTGSAEVAIRIGRKVSRFVTPSAFVEGRHDGLLSDALGALLAAECGPVHLTAVPGNRRTKSIRIGSPRPRIGHNRLDEVQILRAIVASDAEGLRLHRTTRP